MALSLIFTLKAIIDTSKAADHSLTDDELIKILKLLSQMMVQQMKRDDSSINYEQALSRFIDDTGFRDDTANNALALFEKNRDIVERYLTYF